MWLVTTCGAQEDTWSHGLHAAKVWRIMVTRGVGSNIIGSYPMLVGLLLIIKWDTCQVMKKMLKQWLKVVMCSTPINIQDGQTILQTSTRQIPPQAFKQHS